MTEQAKCNCELPYSDPNPGCPVHGDEPRSVQRRIEVRAEPRVHEPAGPGEYCTGCFDQGAVWAKHEERARIRQFIEEAAASLKALTRPYRDPDGQECAVEVAHLIADGLLAALDEGASDDA